MTTTAFRSPAEFIDQRFASERLADLGFLARPDLPDRPGPAYLLVALRDEPTLRHYDPERIEYWVADGGRGVRASLTRATPLPLDQRFSWGMVRLVDRLAVTNEYLAFGGWLRAAEVDGATIAVFTSPTPILRRGGHSQAWDEGSDELAAFFARLVGAIDERPSLEPRVTAVDPLVRYAAFLAHLDGRYRASPELRGLNPALWGVLHAEASMLESGNPDAWRAGRRLLSAAGLAPRTRTRGGTRSGGGTASSRGGTATGRPG